MSNNREIHKKRYDATLKLINKFVKKEEVILDIGEYNTFSEILESNGFYVLNTEKIDLDLFPEVVKNVKADIIIALEILEHLISPFPLLKNLPANRLIATVPLRLWFKSAYRNNNNKWDCHYHEFEDWQFDWLLEKSGWKIIYKEKWKSPVKGIGLRPILRHFFPRYYAVYAERTL